MYIEKRLDMGRFLISRKGGKGTTSLHPLRPEPVEGLRELRHAEAKDVLPIPSGYVHTVQKNAGFSQKRVLNYI
jgi:hypothetical protein